MEQCRLCSVQLEMSEYFTHGTEVHGIFSCLYCHRPFKFSKELMVHLNREHKVPTQKFSNGAEFLDRGGTETSLLCVECNKIFQSDGLTTFMKYHAQECRKSTGICPKCGSVLLLSLLGEHIVHCQGGGEKRRNYRRTTTEKKNESKSKKLLDHPPPLPLPSAEVNKLDPLPTTILQPEQHGEEEGQQREEDDVKSFDHHLFPQDEDDEEDVQKFKFDPTLFIKEEVKLDPLLLELDDDKRLGILIRELSDKLKDFVTTTTTTESLNITPSVDDSQTTTTSSNRYEILVNYSLEAKTEDEILNDMILKSSVDCSYCRLVRLIRIDKRQLVIHLLSKHSWDLRVIRTPASVLQSIMESRNHLRPPIKNYQQETPEGDGTKTIIKEEKIDHDTSGNSSTVVDNHSITTVVESSALPSSASSLEQTTTNQQQEEDQNEVKATVTTNNNYHDITDTKLPSPPTATQPDEGSEMKEDKSGNRNESKMEIEERDYKKEDQGQINHKDDDELSTATTSLQWIDFKLALLQKIFHSQNVVYTFTGEKLGEFGEIPCECLLCGFLADSQKNLFPHWRRIHRGVAMKCTMCKGRFLFAGALYSHLCLGTPEPLTLTEIDDDHEGSSDTIGWRYQCSICENQQLPGFFNYMVHIRSDHNKCELCLETLNTQKDLEHHMKKHKLNHFCWKCSVTYCAKPNFMTHLFWKHGTESVDCAKCLKKKWPHIYHFCVPPDYFVCDVCGLYFTRPKALLIHKRLHTGEKLRKCPKTSCQERFISKKLLQKHLDTVHAKPAIDSVSTASPTTTTNILLKQLPIIPTPELSSATAAAAVDNSTTDSPASELKPELIGDIKPETLSMMNGDDDAMSTDGDDTEEAPPSLTSLVPTETLKDKTVEDSSMESSSKTTVPPVVDGATTTTNLIKCDVSTPPLPPIKPLLKLPNGDGSSMERLDTPVEKLRAEDVDIVGSPNPTTKKFEHNSSPEHHHHHPVKPSKPFNLAEIQGPNLSEEESDSESSHELDEPKLQPTPMADSSTLNLVSSNKHDMDICNNHAGDNGDTTVSSVFSSSSSFIKKQDGLLSTTVATTTRDSERLKGSLGSSVESSISESLQSSGSTQKNDNLTSSPLQQQQKRRKTELTISQSTMDISDGIIGLEPLDNSMMDDSMMERAGKPFLQSTSSLLLDDLDEMKQSDDSMSPLLPPLDDFNFSVPEIPTFEENHLPEHIIRENAMFSIQHEHDYCQQNLGNTNLKRKVGGGASTNVYGNGHAHHGRGDLNAKTSPRPRGRPKKLKVRKPSTKKKTGKKRRRRSSSSSSSSSSSCSSCGSNCSCSSSGSSSSSSSSNSDSSDNEGEGGEKHHASKSSKLSPLKFTLPKIKTVKGGPSKKKSKKNGSVAVGGKVVNNGEIVKRPRGAPRKYKKAKLPKSSVKAVKETNENIKPVIPSEVEPYILESDLETDDSGSEEIFHQKQLTDIIGTVKPPIDEVWDMGSEKYLLKLVRGVQNLEELRPPPPPPLPLPTLPLRKEEVKYSLKNSGAPESKLKVRNVPIKPLIVKRNVHSNFNMANFKELTVAKGSSPKVGGGVRSLKPSVKKSSVGNSKKKPTVTSRGGPPSHMPHTALTATAIVKPKVTHKRKGSTTSVVKKSTFNDSLQPYTGHVAVGDDYHHQEQQPSSIPEFAELTSNSLLDGQSSTPTPIPSKNKRAPRGSNGKKSAAAKVKPPLMKSKKADVYVDEKLYCICQCPHDNVSQMIGCDYKGCQYKWFHFECVGILIPPKGKWYCSECREIVRQKRAAAAKVI